MTVVKLRPALAKIKSLLSADKDFPKPLVRVVPQEVLEGEMTEALGAGKSERLEGRLGYRSGQYSHADRQDRAARTAGPAGQVLHGAVRALQRSHPVQVTSG
jgi:hypothetical protein